MIRCSHLMLLTLLSLTGCADNGTPGIPKTPPSPAALALRLAADPGAAISVLEAKAKGAADAVVVAGRIRTITHGYAAFTLTDNGMAYCGEKREESCLTPWDYCCDSKDTIAANLLSVEARTADGKPIATPALPDLRNLDAVKVTGKMVKDEHGNYLLVATGIYRVSRPELPSNILWPQ